MRGAEQYDVVRVSIKCYRGATSDTSAVVRIRSDHSAINSGTAQQRKNALKQYTVDFGELLSTLVVLFGDHGPIEYQTFN